MLCANETVFAPHLTRVSTIFNTDGVSDNFASLAMRFKPNARRRDVKTESYIS